MEPKRIVQTTGILAIIVVFFAVNAVVPEETRILAYVSSFGFMALVSIMFVLVIPLLAKFIRSGFTASLLANRRWIGLFAFFFAVIHVVLVYQFFFNWDIAKAAENPFRNLGTASIIILALMAATSNDAAVRKMGKNWKRLHLLIYVVLVFIVIHSFNLGQIFMSNETVKYSVVFAAVIIILIKWAYKIKYRSIYRSA